MKRTLFFLLAAMIVVSVSAFAQEACHSFSASGRLINAETGSTVANFGEGMVVVCTINGQKAFGFGVDGRQFIFGTTLVDSERKVFLNGESFQATENDHFVQDAAFCLTLDDRKTAYCAYPML